MAWATPLYPLGRVDGAGDILLDPSKVTGDEYDDALAVINNWRSCHSYPLQVIKMTLLGRAKNADSGALVAQRLKRLSSIRLKLSRRASMRLSQMQDIGGCRAVVGNPQKLAELVRMYDEGRMKNPHPTDRPLFVKKYDYVSAPKADGYRSVHYVYRYQTKSAEHNAVNGLRVEIQLRSRLQHAWATAVETVSTFTGQALKSNIGTDQWKRFFALMGTAIAQRERRPLVPGTPVIREVLVNELSALVNELNVGTVLAGYGQALDMTATNELNASTFLLVLNPVERSITITGYNKSQLQQASQDYLMAETVPAGEQQAVLVSVESLSALRAAYPNYYLDTSVFLDAMHYAIAGRPVGDGNRGVARGSARGVARGTIR